MLVGFGYLIRVKQVTGQILLVFEVRVMRGLTIADRMELEQGIAHSSSRHLLSILAYFGERTGGDAMLIRWQGRIGELQTMEQCLFSVDLEFTSGAFTGITGVTLAL